MAERFNKACPNKEYDGARPLNPDHSHFFLVKTSNDTNYGQEVSITSAFEHHLLSKTVTKRSVRKVVLQFPNKLMQHLGLDKLVAQQKSLLEAQKEALSANDELQDTEEDFAQKEAISNQPSSGNTSINIQLNMNLLLLIPCALFSFYLTLFSRFCS